MKSFWDLLPASSWPTQPFIPPRDPMRAGSSPLQAQSWDSPAAASLPSWLTTQVAPSASGTTGPGLADDAHTVRMLADAKRAHDFAMWAFGPPSAPRVPQTSGSAAPLLRAAQPNVTDLATNAAATTHTAPASGAAANPQFDSTPPNQFIADYIARHAGDFRSYAEALGLPRTVATGAALGVSEEARHVVRDGYPYPNLHETPANSFLDWWSSVNESNSRYASQYSNSHADILNGNLNTQKPGIGGYFSFRSNKFFNPMANDTGIVILPNQPFGPKALAPHAATRPRYSLWGSGN
jgi:hypothetical protein